MVQLVKIFANNVYLIKFSYFIIVNGLGGWEECIGLTYEPQAKEWTLRSGGSPQTSPWEETSILLTCTNEQSKVPLCNCKHNYF